VHSEEMLGVLRVAAEELLRAGQMRHDLHMER
jgi:hypothetical protein